MSILNLYISATGHTIDDLVLALEEATKRIKNGNIEGLDCNETGSFYFKRSGSEIESYALKGIDESVGEERFDRYDEAYDAAHGATIIGFDEHGLAVEL